MEGHRRGDIVVVGGTARQRFHDARGYGRPTEDGGVALAPVEAAHLLFRGDLEAVDDDDFAAFVEAQPAAFGSLFLAYEDLRSRGFYLSPARDGWVDDPAGADLVVYPRGAGPTDGEGRFRVRVVGEREAVPVSTLGDLVLAVVDEEGEVTYLETDRPTMAGDTAFTPPSATGRLLADRVVVWDPPPPLYERGFYGQPLGGRELTGALQLSLVEAAFLAREGVLTVDGGAGAVIERGRAVEGERFDRRLAVYAALRSAAMIPKTGFKFGADFRVYDAVTSVDDLGHSNTLVRVIPRDYAFTPRELALDVRLAGGVRKRMVFAPTDGSETDWVSVGRLTP